MPIREDSSTLLTIAAMVPSLFLLYKIYQWDRTEKEPKGLLLKLFLLGALSIIPAVIVELIGTSICMNLFGEGTLLFNLALFILVVGPAEEGFKLLFLRLGSWRNKAFDTMFDGIIYALFVSMGFALFENIGYVQSLGWQAAIVRALTAIPAHASFSVFMGIWYTTAKQCELRGDLPGKKANLQKAFIIPALIHGIYDTIPSIELSSFIFVFFMVVVFTRAYRIVQMMSKSDLPL